MSSISFRLKIMPIYLFGMVAKRITDMGFIESKDFLAWWLRTNT